MDTSQSKGNNKDVKKLLASGADVNAVEEMYGTDFTPLM